MKKKKKPERRAKKREKKKTILVYIFLTVIPRHPLQPPISCSQSHPDHPNNLYDKLLVGKNKDFSWGDIE